MEDSYGNARISLLRLHDDSQHRSSMIDFYPHEVRKLVRRQKIIEFIISILLIAVYLLIMTGSGLSFYFFYEAQNHTNSRLWIFNESCNIGNPSSNYQCILVYLFQFLVGLGAVILVLVSLVKSCCCRWFSWALCVDFFLLLITLFFATVVTIFLEFSLIFSSDIKYRCDSEIGSFCRAYITSWGVVSVVIVTIILEMILALIVFKCRRRMTNYRHRLE